MTVLVALNELLETYYCAEGKEYGIRLVAVQHLVIMKKFEQEHAYSSTNCVRLVSQIKVCAEEALADTWACNDRRRKGLYVESAEILQSTLRLNSVGRANKLLSLENNIAAIIYPKMPTKNSQEEKSCKDYERNTSLTSSFMDLMTCAK